MFEGCFNLEKISFNKDFKTNLVTNMIYLFYKCFKLKEFNSTSFNTEKVGFFDYMFSECQQIKSIDISSFKIKNESKQIDNMFDNLKSIDKIKVNQNNIDLFKESFANYKEKFYY